MPPFPNAIPLTLYVHIPWCVRKCPYCDFNSHPMREPLPENAYIAALLADLEQDLPYVQGRQVESVFLGGGTPSLFSAEAIDRLLLGLRARLPLHPDLEITLEANPGTVEQGKFQEFREAGINRLSLGVQSFDAGHLRRLSRIHGPEEAIRAAETAHGAGFDNFNLDLMYGLPGQSPAQALADLETAITLAPTHLSHYQLTLEPNTLFHKYPPRLPEEDDIWMMQERCQERLAQAGYRHYEISAYARPGRRCRHNLNYWEFGDYLGIGAGAHTKLTDSESGVISRSWKLKNPHDYLKNAPRVVGGKQSISRAELGLEFMMNALRLIEGFPAALLESRTGLDLEALQPTLRAACERGLLVREDDRLRPSERGRHFLNDLLEMFLPDR